MSFFLNLSRKTSDKNSLILKKRSVFRFEFKIYATVPMLFSIYKHIFHVCKIGSVQEINTLAEIGDFPITLQGPVSEGIENRALISEF